MKYINMKYINKKKLVFLLMLFLVGIFLLWESITFLLKYLPGKAAGMQWLPGLEAVAAEPYIPMLTMLSKEKREGHPPAGRWDMQAAFVPWLKQVYEEGWDRQAETQENAAYRALILEDDSTDYYAMMQQENERLPEVEQSGIPDACQTQTGSDEVEQDAEKVEEKEDDQSGQSDEAEEMGMKRREETVYEYDIEQLKDYEALVKSFYVIDANTSAGPEELNAEVFLQKHYSVEKHTEEPVILIYHTHSREGFADSAQGDVMTTVVGAGERLAACLQEYGYCVLHDTTSFDSESRDYAYSEALPYIENLLKEHPTISVIIDLHRDEMREDTHLVTNIDGKECARYMFFNGMSRLRKSGKIEYLENPFLEDNLGFSFQLQKASNEYYPGLSRKIYLKAYRYNLHLRPASVLIELGAQNNTVEEIMNACVPLAQVIDTVLCEESGGESTETES